MARDPERGAFEAAMDSLQNAVIARALQLIADGKLTPELALSMWQELAAGERFKRRVITHGVLATLMGQEAQERLTGTVDSTKTP